MESEKWRVRNGERERERDGRTKQRVGVFVKETKIEDASECEGRERRERGLKY